MKKSLIIFSTIIFSLIFTSPLSAETNFGRGIKNTIKETVEEGKEAGISPKEIRKNVREEVREQVRERNEGLLEQIKNFVKKNLRFDARLTCTITALSPTFTVDCDGNSYTINVNDKTRYIRKFGGKSNFSELKAGDEVNIFGKFTDEGKTMVDAKLIRDLSIQKRWGVFFGEIITAPANGSFVMKTIQRGNLTVYFGNDTKFMDHKKEKIDPTEIKTGMRVRVKGVWDKTLGEIRETEEVRVFPQRPTLTPTP